MEGREKKKGRKERNLLWNMKVGDNIIESNPILTLLLPKKSSLYYCTFTMLIWNIDIRS